MNDKCEVIFKSKKSEYDNCICSACHGTGRVVKIKLPTTLYHNGETLSTKYSEYWLCDNCKTKLINALGGNTIMIQNGNNNTHIDYVDMLNL